MGEEDLLRRGVAEERAVREHLLVGVLVPLRALDHAVEAEHAAVVRRVEDQDVLSLSHWENASFAAKVRENPCSQQMFSGIMRNQALHTILRVFENLASRERGCLELGPAAVDHALHLEAHGLAGPEGAELREPGPVEHGLAPPERPERDLGLTSGFQFKSKYRRITYFEYIVVVPR